MKCLLLLVFAISIGYLVLNSTNFFNGKKFEETIHQQHPFKDGLIKIDNNVGAISIEGSTTDKIEINIVKKAKSRELLKEIKLHMAVKANKAHIKADTKNNDTEVNIEIKVPKDTKLEKIYTNVGSIKLNDISQEVNCQTKCGAIELNNISGNITAITNTGAIDINNSTKSVKASANVGAIYLNQKLLDNLTIELSTNTGKITLLLPTNVNAEVNAQLTTGSICSSFNEIKIVKTFPYISSQAHGVIGLGESKISLKSNVGQIVIKSN